MFIGRKVFSLVILVSVSLLTSCSEQMPGIGAKLNVGDSVPKSNNLTVVDQNKWYEISTMDTKAPLYKWNIAELIEQRKPFLVVFGTPQHCTMCVDQITRIAVMEEKYGEQFAFLHVDGYKDNGIWVEWGVKGEPWTYFVDAEGKVASVFPGQTELGLLELEIDKLMPRDSG